MKAVFRGGPSGCGYTEETNMRIKLVSMEFQEPDNMVFLDVALTGKGKTIDSQSIKFDPKYGIGMLNTSIKPGGFISMLEQSNYKYIIHIDGNVNAYRLLTTMRTGSLILRVKSEYRSWVDHLIQRNVHYIEIDADLSNLEETIIWCLDNDETCKKIAKNGLDFAIDVLQKPFIKSYVQKILWSLSKYQDKESGSLSPINSPIKSSSSDIIKIQLGDVIQLIAPDNETFNQQFYVKYIDLTKIVLGNINTMQVISLSLTDGQINDRDIQSIELLSRAEYPGYARQNKLVPGVWLNIYFKGLDGVPFIVTGIITDLEEDSIQITTYPNRDIIYIDFGYKGLPENLPIEKIVKTNKPERGMVGVEETRESELITTNVEGDEFGTTINEEMNDRLNEIILDADRLMLGEDLDEITLFDEIDESNRRYGIEKQMTDLLDELLSEVPNYKRTISVQNDIHTMIERYSQLRTLFSNFDSNGNANMPAPLNNGRKPIIDNIVNLNQNFHWLLPVSYNIKKLYNLDAKDEFDDSDGISLFNDYKMFENEMTITETYENGKVPTENKFLHLFKSLNTLYTPFMNPLDSIDNITTRKY